MSSKKIIKCSEVSFSSGTELRAQEKIILTCHFVETKKLEIGKRVSLSIKAGCRRKIFTGYLFAAMPSCSYHHLPEFYTVEK